MEFSKIKLNKCIMIFISNIDINNSKGGWDGLGSKFYELLKLRYSNLNLLENVNPTPIWFEKFFSVFLRKFLKKRGDYFFYSNRILKNVSNIFQDIS